MIKKLTQLMLTMFISMLITHPALAAIKKNIIVSGISDPMKKNVVARLNGYIAQFGKALQDHEREALETDGVEQVKQALAPFGYFEPKITQTLTAKAEQIVLKYKIIPGRRMKVTSVQVRLQGEGRNDPQLIQYTQHLPIKVGAPLETEKYESIKSDLLTTADHQGFAKAQVTHSRLTIDLKRYQAKMLIVFDTGPRYFFDDIIFEGTAMDRNLLRAYLPTQPGDPFTSDAVAAIHDAIVGSNYFSEVKVEPEMQHAENQRVPVVVHLKLRNRHQVTYGAGFGTDSGPRGSFSWHWNPTNKWGHRTSVSLQVSQVKRTGQFSYDIPTHDPRHSHYSLGVSVFDVDYARYDSRSQLVNIAYIENRDNWQRTFSINSLYEDFNNKLDPRINPFNRDARNVGSFHTYAFYPNFYWKWQETDDPLNPQKGYSFSINVAGGTRHVLSDSDFIGGQANARVIYPLYKDKTRVELRGSLGALSIANLNTLPPTLRYYLGGTQNLRGYQIQELGPGRKLISGSADLYQRIYDKWWVGVFYDIGNASESFQHGLKRDYGFLIVRETPVGPIRIGLARAIDFADKPLTFIFSMGPNL